MFGGPSSMFDNVEHVLSTTFPNSLPAYTEEVILALAYLMETQPVLNNIIGRNVDNRFYRLMLNIIGSVVLVVAIVQVSFTQACHSGNLIPSNSSGFTRLGWYAAVSLMNLACAKVFGKILRYFVLRNNDRDTIELKQLDSSGKLLRRTSSTMMHGHGVRRTVGTRRSKVLRSGTVHG